MRKLFLAAILCSIAVLTLPMSAGSQEFATNYHGIGLGGAGDWEKAFIFADAVKSSRRWKTGNGDRDLNGSEVTPDGWPKVDGNLFICANQDIHGRYTLYFEGTAIVKPNGWGSITPVEHVNGISRAYIDLEPLPDDRGKNFWLTFTNTNGGVRNVRLMRPIYPGAKESHDTTEVFARELVKVIKKFRFVRYMDFLGTNSDQYHLRKQWKDRVRPGYATQFVQWRLDGANHYSQTHPTDLEGKNPASWFSAHGAGGAYEYVALLANKTQTDAWICIPHVADDEYVRKIALAFKNGTDGYEPYEQPVANPVYPPLNQHLKLYVEYSNEIWNWNFNQNNYLFEKYKHVQDNPDGVLNPTDGKLPFAWYNCVPKRTAEISKIFRSVFGDDQMMSRVRPLMQWQKGKTGNANATGSKALVWLNDFYGVQDAKGGEPRGVNYYLYGGGGSGYYQAGENVSLDQLWNSDEFDVNEWIPKQRLMQQYCAAFGLRRAIYEGGPSFGDQNAGSSSNPIGEKAILDARISQEIIDHQKAWNKVGGGLFGYFVLAGDHRWGFMQQPGDVNSFKLQGIDAIKGQPRDPIAFGPRVTPTEPVVIKGNRWFLRNSNYGADSENSEPSDQSVKIAPGEWYAWDFHTAVMSECAINITYKTASASNVVVYHGSTKLKTVALAATTTSKVSQKLTTIANNDMLHAIRLKAENSTVEIETITITFERELAQPSSIKDAAVKPAYRKAVSVRFAGNHTPRIVLNHTQPQQVSLTRLNGAVVQSWLVEGAGTTQLILNRHTPGAYIVSMQSTDSRATQSIILP